MQVAIQAINFQERDRRVAELQTVVQDDANQIHQLHNEVEVSDNHSEA